MVSVGRRREGKKAGRQRLPAGLVWIGTVSVSSRDSRIAGKCAYHPRGLSRKGKAPADRVWMRTNGKGASAFWWISRRKTWSRGLASGYEQALIWSSLSLPAEWKPLLVSIGWMEEACRYVSFSSFLWRSFSSITEVPFNVKEIYFFYYYYLPKPWQQSLSWLHPTFLAPLMQTSVSWVPALVLDTFTRIQDHPLPHLSLSPVFLIPHGPESWKLHAPACPRC